MIDITPELEQWLALHSSEDTFRLRLRHHADPILSQAIDQIDRRRKAAGRFPLALSHKRFIIPTDLSVEQATSEALAAIHASLFGTSFNDHLHLDLTCGLGMDAFEMARRGAKVTAIDLNLDVAEAASHNSRVMELDQRFRAIAADSSEFINDPTLAFDSIFIDPARRADSGRRLVALADCAPDVTSMMKRLLMISPKVMVKASPMLDISAVIAELNAAAGTKGAVSRIIALGTARECKEVVAIVERGAVASPLIQAITLLPSSEINTFTTGLRSPEQSCAIPTTGDFLYEPYPAVMKLAAWGSIQALSPELSQLNPNTHIFTSRTPVDTFPGLAMRVERVEPLNDKALKSISRDYPMANVTTRNFIISAPELARRLKIKEGGSTRIYGVRAGASASLILIVASPT